MSSLTIKKTAKPCKSLTIKKNAKTIMEDSTPDERCQEPISKFLSRRAKKFRFELTPVKSPDEWGENWEPEDFTEEPEADEIGEELPNE